MVSSLRAVVGTITDNAAPVTWPQVGLWGPADSPGKLTGSPPKAWRDCLRGPKFQACGEIALLRPLRQGATLAAAGCALADDSLVQVLRPAAG